MLKFAQLASDSPVCKKNSTFAVSMLIRKATFEDLPQLMMVYCEGREIMLSCGDVNQWKPGYPSEEIISNDISAGRTMAVTDNDGKIAGAFAFITGADPTYSTIEGEWIDDVRPYATIHRLASLKSSKGVAAACFDWSWAQIHNLRIDTHEDNVIMRHCIEKAGFKYCGVIHLLNGDPRLAYQKIY